MVEDDLDGAGPKIENPGTDVGENLCQASVMDVTRKVTFQSGVHDDDALERDGDCENIRCGRENTVNVAGRVTLETKKVADPGNGRWKRREVRDGKVAMWCFGVGRECGRLEDKEVGKGKNDVEDGGDDEKFKDEG